MGITIMLGYKKDKKKDALFSSHEASYLKEEASVRYRTFLCRDNAPLFSQASTLHATSQSNILNSNLNLDWLDPPTHASSESQFDL
jgi:hypothetical protein